MIYQILTHIPPRAGAITLSTADSCEDRRTQKPDVLARHAFYIISHATLSISNTCRFQKKKEKRERTFKPPRFAKSFPSPLIQTKKTKIRGQQQTGRVRASEQTNTFPWDNLQPLATNCAVMKNSASVLLAENKGEGRGKRRGPVTTWKVFQSEWKHTVSLAVCR